MATGSAPLAGLTIGAVAAGLVGAWTAHPLAWMFFPLLLIFAAAAVFSRLMPETAPGRASPAIVRQAFGLNGASIGGVAIGLLTGAGAIVPCAARAVPARAVAVAANLAMLTGVAAALAAIELRSIALFLAASAVGGAGFGAGFSSWIRLMIPDVAPAERTRFYSAFYLVNYLAFGLPALVAGELIGAVGLDTTVLAYGALAMTAAVAGLRNEISMGRSDKTFQRNTCSFLMCG